MSRSDALLLIGLGAEFHYCWDMCLRIVTWAALYRVHRIAVRDFPSACQLEPFRGIGMSQQHMIQSHFSKTAPHKSLDPRRDLVYLVMFTQTAHL
jgi:hypothetical protein